MNTFNRSLRRAALALAALVLITSTAMAEWTVGDMIRARRATAEHALRNGVPRHQVQSYREVVRNMSMLLEILPDEVLDIEMVPSAAPPTTGPITLNPGHVKPSDGSSIPWYGPDFVGPIIRR